MTGPDDHRRALLGVCLFTLAVATLAALPAAFIATSFLPSAWWTIPVIFISFSVAAWWVWRHHDRADRAESAQAETEVLSLADIAGHQPAPRPRRDLSGRLRRICGRARSLKESAR